MNLMPASCRHRLLLSVFGSAYLLAVDASRVEAQNESDIFDQEGAALFDALVGQQFRQMAQDITAQSAIRNKLNSQIVSKVDFKDAPLRQVVDFVKVRSQELSKDGQPINMIVTRAAREKAQGHSVDLKLANVPLGVVLRYSMEQLGLVPRVEQYAVVVDVPRTIPVQTRQYPAPSPASTPPPQQPQGVQMPR